MAGGKGRGLFIFAFSLMGAAILCPPVMALGYYCTSESVEASIYGGGTSMFVTQSLSLYCYQGSVSRVNVTFPYSSRELRDLEDNLIARTRDATDLEVETEIEGNKTLVTILLADRLYAGQEVTLILKYRLENLGDSIGATTKDFLFGRTGANTLVRLKVPFLEVDTEELMVRIYPPSSKPPKDWEPRANSAKTWRADGTIGIIWHITTGVPSGPEFRIVFGEGGWRIKTLDILGICLAMVAIMIIHRFRKK